MSIDMQALIEEMGVLIERIKSGTATMGELEAFTAAAAELHQRSIILRYKAYEAKIFGMPEASVPQPETTEISNEIPETQPEVEMETAPEVTAEVQHTEEEEISFDLFGESEESVEMDLFSEEPAIEVSAPEVEMHVVAEFDEEPVAEETPSEPEMQLVADEEIAEEEESLSEPTMEMASEEEVAPETTMETEPVAVEETAEPMMEESAPEELQKPEPVMTSGGNEHPVYSRLSSEDNSLAARLMAVRLESLKGAFGFNERLQIIQELFNGSNDAFMQAIEHIDTLSSKLEARMLVSRYAHQFEWDKDSNLALEFVQKVERRFA